MGNFYVNFTVKRGDQQRVADALKRAKCKAFITPPINGDVVVFEEESDTQDTGVIERVGALLSRDLDAAVLAVLNHDDDALCYWLFEDGRLSDSYNSCPDYFGETDEAEPDRGGDAQRLCEALSAPSAAGGGVDGILRGEDVAFAIDRHAALVQALGLPACTVGAGYRYLQSGESLDGVDPGEVIRVA